MNTLTISTNVFLSQVETDYGEDVKKLCSERLTTKHQFQIDVEEAQSMLDFVLANRQAFLASQQTTTVHPIRFGSRFMDGTLKTAKRHK